MTIKNKVIILILFLCGSNLFAQDSLEITTEPVVIALYKNCGNEIKIIKPLISEKDNIKYNFKGGMILTKENDNRFITLVPNSSKVTLSIYRDSVLVGLKEFKVRLIPKPTIKVYADSNLIENINYKNERITKTTKYITIKAIPDEQLVFWMPYDARYIINSWQIFLIRGDKQIDSLSYTSETGNIKKLLSKSKEGDIVYLEVYKAKRINFLNKEEEVKLDKINKTYLVK